LGSILPLKHRKDKNMKTNPTSTYWGAAGEQIDLRSGNLNFRLPLVKAVGRGGSGFGLGLSYNSTNWRQDPGGTWQLGHDVGYGYGWKLQAGSILPVYSDWLTVHHYLFTDASGAEYRLDQNTNGVWTSKEGIYAAYDTSTQRLYFPDGTFWFFGSVSAGTEEDAGTLYPTQFQDTNGNQILLRYGAASGLPWTGSSARIVQVEDVRAGGTPPATYNFTYNTDTIPHLTSIANTIGTAETYTLTMGSQTLTSPFNSTSYGPWTTLASVQQAVTNQLPIRLRRRPHPDEYAFRRLPPLGVRQRQLHRQHSSARSAEPLSRKIQRLPRDRLPHRARNARRSGCHYRSRRSGPKSLVLPDRHQPVQLRPGHFLRRAPDARLGPEGPQRLHLGPRLAR
jgi:hypothetical protein